MNREDLKNLSGGSIETSDLTIDGNVSIKDNSKDIINVDVENNIKKEKNVDIYELRTKGIISSILGI